MKLNLKPVLKTASSVIRKHSPEILVGAGIVMGMVVTPILAVKVTPAAAKAVEDISRENHDGDPHAATKKEIVKAAWKYYAPLAVMEAASIACVIGANKVSFKRNAALATAYALSESNLKEFKDKVAAELGAKKESEILDHITQDRIDADPCTDDRIFDTRNGNTLCYDAWSGRYFKSDIEHLRRAQNSLNHALLRDDYISLNDVYDEIGLPAIESGGYFGWVADKGLIDFDFRTMLTDDGTPCLVLAQSVRPGYDG